MSPELFIKEVTMALVGAKQSVDIMCSRRSGWTFPLSLADISSLCDQRLTLRYLVRGSPLGEESIIDSSLRNIVGESWQIRCSYPDRPTGNCIMVDRHCVFSMSVDRSRPSIHHVRFPERCRELVERFQRLWNGASDVDNHHFAFEAEIDSLFGKDVRRIGAFASEVWDSLIRNLIRNPHDLYSLEPRRFEELIAELLRRDGYDTELTPITRDGGRDVLATLHTPIGKQLFLVECKRYAENRPVGVSIVRELFGVVTAERATGGLIATTSTFTRDAQNLQQTFKYQLSMKDFYDLQLWLKQTVGLE